MKPEISFLFVNYDSEDYLLRSLHSIIDDSVPVPYEIIVIDNASKEGLPLRITSVWPGVRLLISEENLGFAKAANYGVRQARGKYVVLVNPDTLVYSGTIAKLYDFMENNPDAAGVSPQAFYTTGEHQPVARRFITLGYILFGRRSIFHRFMPNNPFTRRYLYSGIEHSPLPVEVEALIGAFMFLRREAFLDVGGFDERFFFYAEDIDLCRRLHRKGWKIYLHPGARIIHFYGGSRKRIHLFSEYHRMKAFYKFFTKHLSGLKAIQPILAQGLAAITTVMMFTSIFGAEPKEPSWIRERKRK